MRIGLGKTHCNGEDFTYYYVPDSKGVVEIGDIYYTIIAIKPNLEEAKRYFERFIQKAAE